MDHFFLFNNKDRAGADRSGCAYTKGDSCEARLTKEVTGAQDGDNRWRATFRLDREHHIAFPDKKERVGRFALGVDDLFVPVLRDRPSQEALEERLFRTC